MRAIAQLLSEHLKKTSENLSELMPPAYPRMITSIVFLPTHLKSCMLGRM